MSTIPTLITDHIDIWTAADTEKKSGRGRSSANAASVYGIKKLRELILELAVHGKLVPQDANDEPASELLKRIQAEKARLIADGKIKKDKLLPIITENEKPFDLPQGWLWARLGFVGVTQTGTTPGKSNADSFGSDIPFVKPGDIYPNYVDYNNEGLSFLGAEQSGRIACAGSLLMVCIGTIGKCNLIERDCSFNQQINSITPYAFDAHYLLAVCRSLYFQNEAWSRSSSTTIPILNKGNWEEICIPVPPYEEQHRIVAKVDELMALCDQLETQHNNAAEAHEKLVSHLLGTLTQSQNADDFSANWQRIAVHFDNLFTTEASIDALKQTLLQLAVMGKLVPQDPNDEPASELLKRIQAEKAKLIAEGKIKKDKPLLAIAEDKTHAYELPCGWKLARWGQISNWITYGFTRPMPHVENGIPIVTGKNVNYGRIVLENADFTTVEAYRELNAKDRPDVGDILVTKDGSIGRTAIVETNERFCINQSVAVIWLRSCELSRRFLKIVLDCPETQFAFLAKSEGVAIKHISVVDLGMMLLRIPPLAEQHRIVAKVDELTALCDQLKCRLTEANQLQQKLADVMVEQAVA